MLNHFNFSLPDDQIGKSAAAALYKRLNRDWQLDRLESQVVVELASLSFYENVELYRLQVRLDGVEYQAHWLWSGRSIGRGDMHVPVPDPVHLDGTSPPIHKLNKKVPLKLPVPDPSVSELPGEVIDYLRLFCGLVTGEEGPFLIIETLDDLPGLSRDYPQDEASRQEFNGKLQKIRPLVGITDKTKAKVTGKGDREEEKPKVENKWQLNTTLAYGGQSFRASMAIQTSGKVEMLDDEPLDKLPLDQRIWRQGIPGVRGIWWFRTGVPADQPDPMPEPEPDAAGTLLGVFGFKRADRSLSDYLLEATDFTEPGITSLRSIPRPKLGNLGPSRPERGSSETLVEVADVPFYKDVELYRIRTTQAEKAYESFFLWSGQQVLKDIVPDDRPVPTPIALSGDSKLIKDLNRPDILELPAPDNDSPEARDTVRRLAHFLCALGSGSKKNGTFLLERPSDLPGLWEQIADAEGEVDAGLFSQLEISPEYGELDKSGPGPSENASLPGDDGIESDGSNQEGEVGDSEATANSGRNAVDSTSSKSQVSPTQKDDGVESASLDHAAETKAAHKPNQWRIVGVYASDGGLYSFELTIRVVRDGDQAVEIDWSKIEKLSELPGGWQVWRNGIKVDVAGKQAKGNSTKSSNKTDGQSKNRAESEVEQLSTEKKTSPKPRVRFGYWFTVGSDSGKPGEYIDPAKPNLKKLVTLPAFWALLCNYDSAGDTNTPDDNRLIQGLRVIDPLFRGRSGRVNISLARSVEVRAVEFRCRVNLDRCIMASHLMFHDCRFEHDLSMFAAHVKESFTLLGCEFKRACDLSEIQIDGRLSLRFDSKIESDKDLNLSGARVSGSIEVWSTNPNMVRFKAVKLYNAQIGRNLYIGGLTAIDGLSLGHLVCDGFVSLDRCQSGKQLSLNSLVCKGHVLLNECESGKNLTLNHLICESYVYLVKCLSRSDILFRGIRCGWLQFDTRRPDPLPDDTKPVVATKTSCSRVIAERRHKFVSGVSGQEADGADQPDTVYDVGGHIELSYAVIKGPTVFRGVHVRGAIHGRGAEFGSLFIGKIEAEDAAKGEDEGNQQQSTKQPADVKEPVDPEQNAGGADTKQSQLTQESVRSESEQPFSVEKEQGDEATGSPISDDDCETDSKDSKMTPVENSTSAYTGKPKPFREAYVGLGVAISNCTVSVDLFVSFWCDSAFIEELASNNGLNTSIYKGDRFVHPVGQHLLGMVLVSRCSIGRNLSLCGGEAERANTYDNTGGRGRYSAGSAIEPSPMVAPRGIHVEHTTTGADLDLRDVQCEKGEISLRNVSVKGSLRLDSICSYVPVNNNLEQNQSECSVVRDICRTTCQGFRIDGLTCHGAALLGGLVVRSNDGGQNKQSETDAIDISLVTLSGDLKLQSTPSLLMSIKEEEHGLERTAMECQGSIQIASAEIAGHLDMRGIKVKQDFRLDDISIGRDLQAGTPLRQPVSARTQIGRDFGVTELRCDGDAIFTGLDVGTNNSVGRIRAFEMVRSEVKGLVKFVHRHDRLPDRGENQRACIGGSIHFNYTKMSQLYLSELNIRRMIDDAGHTLPVPLKLEKEVWHERVKMNGGIEADVFFVLTRARIDLLHMRFILEESKSKSCVGYDISGVEVTSWEFRHSHNDGSNGSSGNKIVPELDEQEYKEAFTHILSRDRQGLRKTYVVCETWLTDRDLPEAAEHIRKLMHERQIRKLKERRAKPVKNTAARLHKLRLYPKFKWDIVRRKFLCWFGYGKLASGIMGLVVLTAMLAMIFAQPDNIVPSINALEVDSDLGLFDNYPHKVVGVPAHTHPSIAGNPKSWGVGDGLLLSLRHTLPMISPHLIDEWRPSPYDYYTVLYRFDVSVEMVANVGTLIAWMLWVFILVSAAGALRRVRLSMNS